MLLQRALLYKKLFIFVHPTITGIKGKKQEANRMWYLTSENPHMLLQHPFPVKNLSYLYICRVPILKKIIVNDLPNLTPENPHMLLQHLVSMKTFFYLYI
jgi:hypothetical protein